MKWTPELQQCKPRKWIMSNKTNQNWYFYKDMRCFYKLVDGELWFSEIQEDHKLDEGGDPVDFDIVAGGFIDLQEEKLVTDRLKEIVAELEEKS